LARNTWAGQVQLFDVGTGQKLIETAPNTCLQYPTFIGDDCHLAAAVQRDKLGPWQVADGRELRLLVATAWPQESSYVSATVSPNGRLLAAARSEGVDLWDLTSGSALASLPTGLASPFVLFEPSGALLTASEFGVVRWPVREMVPGSGQWTCGPPQKVVALKGEMFDLSADGKVLVTCLRRLIQHEGSSGGWLLHLDRAEQPLRLDDPRADVGNIAVSPDGRWVVTVTHWGGGKTKLWDGRDGTFVKELISQGGRDPHFSPDGRWLDAGFDGGRLLAVGTWEPGAQMGGRATFSPHGRLTAVNTDTSVVILADRTNGRELARLHDPHGGVIDAVCFSPDGTRLVTLGSQPVPGIRVWDLQLLRRGLRELDLDWEGEPLPPTAAPARATRRPTATVDRGQLDKW
jgi:WD40 repeat protein